MKRNLPILVAVAVYFAVNLLASSVAYFHWSDYWTWWSDSPPWEIVGGVALLSIACIVAELIAIIAGVFAAYLVTSARQS